ncbi:MAG: CoA pyrophosphatase [Deltaproteobacteria bacterium]|nr:CoA pyrophosphatase [Deltaproteobacteria bacterium]
MRVDDLPLIEERARMHRPFTAELKPVMRAAVALVVAPDGDELAALLIERAQHPLDPWSGHMAFPGGRHDATDPSLERTAIRETLEEVGIDLMRHGRFVTRLDELQAQARGRNLDMVISPFLFFLDRARETTPDTSEVAGTLWVPLRVFRDERHQGTTHFSRDGFGADFPAFLYQGKTIWGLTYRILSGFLELVRGVGEDASARTGAD